jgi:type IV secretory pathway VirB2 component (pilin)
MNFNSFKRYVPLFVWIVVVSVIILIPLKIIGYGFLPMDDAMRHAAKAVSGKSWQQILVMQDGFQIDPSFGWQKILEWIYHGFGGNAETLVVFSVIALMLLVMLCGLPWFRRPEAWLAALFIAAIFIPACTTRFARGRPYLLTDAILITILFLWSRYEKDWPRRAAIIFTPLLIAASAWIHGSWYLLCLPGAAILFSGFPRLAAYYGVCWLFGSFLGSALTGHPWEFLFQSVRHMTGAFGHFLVNRQLEPEWHPSDGELPAVLAVAVLLVWRKISSGGISRIVLNPIFMMMVLGWLLGLKIRRFWWDFGTPAFIVWVALELQQYFAQHISLDSAKRLFVTLGIAAAAFLGFTPDRDSRWTENLTTEYLAPENPDAVGWLPGAGGIIYNSEMDVFFQTFFKNPTANWKYVLGFEPALMQADDLETLRNIQWNFGDARAYEPWVKKMKRADRMIIRGSYQPQIPELEWHYTGSGMWVGRLPR